LAAGVNRAVNLGLAFLLELAALAALCWWGFHVSAATWVKVVLGIGAPLAAVIVWSLLPLRGRGIDCRWR
jgi:Protein of unknown function (DUF2568)